MKPIPTGNNGDNYSVNLTKVVKGAGINVSGAFLGKTIVFFNTLFLARFLTTADLGLYFLGLSIITVVTTIALMGLRIGMVRFVSIYSGQRDFESTVGTVVTAVVITLVSSIFVTLVLLVTNEWLCTSIFDKPDLANVLVIFICAIPFEVLCKVFLAATQGLKFMHYSVYVEQIIVLVLRFIFFVIIVWGMQMGARGAAAAYLLSTVSGMVAACSFCNREIPFIQIIQKARKAQFKARELLVFSLPMLPTSIIFNAAKQIDILMLGWLGTASAVGIYTICVRLIGFIEVIFHAFQTVLNPFIAELHAKREFAQLSKLFSRVTKWSFTASLPLSLAFFFLPTFFMGIFSEEISNGAICLSILAIVHLFTAPSGLASSMIFMSGRSNIVLVNNLFFLGVSAPLNYFLISAYGVVGAAMAHGLAMFLLAVLRFVEVFNIMDIQPFRVSFLKPIFASIMASSPILLYWGLDAKLSWPAMLFCAMLFLVLYVFTILLVKIDTEDLYIIQLFKVKALKALSTIKDL